MSSSTKIEKIFKTKEVVHLDFETGEERSVIEVYSIDLINIDSDDEPADRDEIGDRIVEEIDEILDEPEQEESSKTDSWNSSGQTAGNSSPTTSETDPLIEENEEALLFNSSPDPGVYVLSKNVNCGP